MSFQLSRVQPMRGGGGGQRFDIELLQLWQKFFGQHAFLLAKSFPPFPQYQCCCMSEIDEYECVPLSAKTQH